MTDLLLHYLGRDLCDPFNASCLWRTSPLWGLGLSKRENAAAGTHFLHDGRARSIPEAILWHNGEAKKSKENFIMLSPQEKQDLIYFLQSL
jgi:CxxC motif-containing protein (DUF1111 family)